MLSVYATVVKYSPESDIDINFQCKLEGVAVIGQSKP
jgi:hypothetical protein